MLANSLREPPEVTRPGTQPLPPWEDCAVFLPRAMPEPAQIIGSILHRGCKLVLGGASKSRKTWVLLDMALSVAHGVEWLGFSTAKSRVLFVNFELPDWNIHQRIRQISEGKGLSFPSPGELCIWNLRGYAASYDELIPKLIERAREQGFGLVVLDPSYKLLGNADENSARDVALLLNAMERLAVETGAALAFAAHFAKGNAGSKFAMDRISGSGVFVRDPDSILLLTELQTADSYALETILRALPPVQPLAVRWQFPTMQRAPDLNPDSIRQPGGRKKSCDLVELLSCIEDSTQESPVTVSQWATVAGVPRGTLREYLPDMRERGWIGSVGEGPKARKYITENGKKKLNNSTGENSRQ